MVEDKDEDRRPAPGPPMRMVVAPEIATQHPETVEKLSCYQLIYSVLGLVLGLVCVIGGIVLFLHGVAGSTNWIAKILGAESQISDAAPGAVLFVVGLFIVWVTRFKLKIRR